MPSKHPSRSSLVVSLVAAFGVAGFGAAACSKSDDPGGGGAAGGAPGKTGGSGGSKTGGSGGGSNTGGTGGPASGGSGAQAGSGGGGGTGGTPATGGSGPASGGAGGGTGGAPGNDAATPGETSPPASDTGPVTPGARFSFFVTSFEALQRLSKNPKGFGGDLRYGEADGVSGADKVCTEIAESVVPGSGAKGWKAFLSAEKGPGGTPVNAIERIGEGPWYDRKGRLFAMTKADLLFERPRGIDPIIRDDFPNEHGIINSQPVAGKGREDNHHFLTGSTATGMLMGTNTCNSWTTTMTTPATRPRIGFSFIAGNRRHWISGQTEGGCGAGAVLTDGGGSDPSNPIVGSGGGYGGWYCFALKP